MLSICIAYYNRPEYLKRTLSLYYILHQERIKDYEFIIIDDGSRNDLRASLITKEFEDKMDIKVFYRENKDDINPAVAINASIKLAKNDTILITCPETFPASPFLYEINKQIMNINEYLLIPCYSIPVNSQLEIEKLDLSDINGILKCINLYPRIVNSEGDDGWYSHPQFRPVLFYFAAVIKKRYFFHIGGIDEDFRYGWGYEDDDFCRRIKLNGTKISWLSNSFCLHQYHYTNPNTTRQDDIRIEGWRRNKELFDKKSGIIM